MDASKKSGTHTIMPLVLFRHQTSSSTFNLRWNLSVPFLASSPLLSPYLVTSLVLLASHPVTSLVLSPLSSRNLSYCEQTYSSCFEGHLFSCHSSYCPTISQYRGQNSPLIKTLSHNHKLSHHQSLESPSSFYQVKSVVCWM